MTKISDLQKVVHYLEARIDTLEMELKETKKELEDSENAFEVIHQEYEQLELETQSYVDNKEFLDSLNCYTPDLKSFVEYLEDECAVKPANEHVYRCYLSEVKKFIGLIGG